MEYFILYISENKEWLFSGLGITFFTLVFGGLFLKNDKKEIVVIRDIEKNESIANSPVKNEETEVVKLSLRFSSVLKLMNENRNYDKFNISRLAQIMKLHKVSELEDFFTGKEEPTFDFISNFCENFGVSYRWLTEGDGSPFENRERTNTYPYDYLEEILTLNPETVYFIRASTEISEAFILLKISDWKYKIFPRIWHVSDHVGGTGSAQLESLYNLIIELRDNRNIYCSGRTLESKQFNKLVSGNKFPGAYIDSSPSNDPWWDDLTDINHSYPIAENYERWHGISFIKAQTIIKSRVKDREHS